MVTVLFYFLVASFWAENILDIGMTGIQGLSIQNLIIYLLLIIWAFNIVEKAISV